MRSDCGLEPTGSHSQATGKNLIIEARKLLGSPFFHQGRRADTGVDCVGLILLPARALGLSTFEPANYSPTGWGGYLYDCLNACCERLPSDEERQPGDVLLFAIRGQPSHLAYWTGSSILHAHQRVNCVLEEPLGEVWARCLLSVWRWRGLAE